ncbi:succinylglutamate desuccinylase/aspartoacylase family protein [Oscillatoria salina]|uniref:succinylglutamate desuccinylase/aspartoacylase family protein n=1 Tax=Oscillatoria salina TaxID=331517 RepID=UPI0013BAA17D|nr:succinylglutamate desuccinylase/aspartoacylase family protein [Oscillatoria salina]MBZ8181731.1 succinylglutamate desuccinylase/aspartoacylase family protein [Oscillatoria salina IIICB1]NET89904.1 succinylglutamate desuccinylase/aspartoacylase family protein [Kamptonema sp. SIO1D9]
MIPKIDTFDLLQLASGDRLSLQVYKFIGSKPGKKAYLQSNLHGAEIVGNAVIHQLIEFFSSLESTQLEGEIWLVPVCNPLSTNQRSHFFASGRYNSYDGKDWNRIFWDYEKETNRLDSFVSKNITEETEELRYHFLEVIQAAFQKQIAKIHQPSSLPYHEQYRYILQSLCLDANYALDIHSSSNQAIDYLYCSQSREDSAKYFLLDYGIVLNEYDGDAFDEAFIKPWLALEKKLAQLGQETRFDLESWTLELGSGMQMERESVDKGFRGIINYLAAKEMLQLAEFPLAETAKHQITLVEKSKIKKYYTFGGGMIQEIVPLGSRVQPGDRLYQLLSFNKQGKVPTAIEICAEATGIVFDVATNKSVNQGEYVLSIMEI